MILFPTGTLYEDFKKNKILVRPNTGWFKANLYTLTAYYDKYTMCFKKIVVELFSEHMDISFYSNKSEQITFNIVKI